MSQLEAVERLEKRLETADLNVMLHKSEIQHTMHLKTENVKMRYEVLCVFLCSAKQSVIISNVISMNTGLRPLFILPQAFAQEVKIIETFSVVFFYSL